MMKAEVGVMLGHKPKNRQLLEAGKHEKMDSSLERGNEKQIQILVFYCCFNKLLHLGGSKQHTFIILLLWMSEVSSGSRVAKIKALAERCSFWRLQVKIGSCFFTSCRGCLHSLAHSHTAPTSAAIMQHAREIV